MLFSLSSPLFSFPFLSHPLSSPFSLPPSFSFCWLLYKAGLQLLGPDSPDCMSSRSSEQLGLQIHANMLSLVDKTPNTQLVIKTSLSVSIFVLFYEDHCNNDWCVESTSRLAGSLSVNFRKFFWESS